MQVLTFMFMLLDTTSCCLTLHSTQGDVPRFSRSQIQQTACLARTMPALNCSDVALVTRHAWSQLTQSYWNIVLLTETVFNNEESWAATTTVPDSADSCRIWVRTNLVSRHH